MTLIVGLTGSIATGKSTVTNIFVQQGIPVVDSDKIAREVVEPGTIGLAKIVEHFGSEILQRDGYLNRKKLGTLIFSDSEKRDTLNSMLADELWKAIGGAIQTYRDSQVAIAIADIPRLYEAHYEELVDVTMVVYVPERIQLERLMKRDNLSEEEARRRIQSQMSIEEKRQRADVVIDNSSTLEETSKQVLAWLEERKSR